jgi:predicted ester cyclase
MSAENKNVVMRYENQFKNEANVDIVYELMSENFVHHAPIPGVGEGRDGLKQIGQFIFSMIDGIEVEIKALIGEGDLVSSRVEAHGRLKANGEPVSWTENHLYQLSDGKIVEWWGEGGPPLG